MAELTVDMMYGHALYLAAEEDNKIEQIGEEANEISKIFKEEEGLYDLIKSPALSAAEKKKIIEKVFGGRISEELNNFICILLDKGRITHFQGIVRQYNNLKNKAEAISDGIVYSTEPLSDDQLSRLEAQTGKLLKEKVSLKNEIDSKLIGGLKILIDGKVIDASLKKGLEEMSLIMKA